MFTKAFVCICLICFTSCNSVNGAAVFDKDGLHKLKTSKEGNHGNTKTPSPTPHLATTDWWQLGQDDLQKYLALQPQTGVAKNVIMFVGDGMGITTETVTRFYMAQTQNKQIFDAKFSWDEMPYTGLSKTYNTDAQVPDSAGTATAIFCGEKARDGVIGVNQNVVLGNCSTLTGNEIPSIIHHSIEAGKWTGVVSTARITHATPAAAYAHSPHRDWESIGDIDEADWGTCKDIAYQLIHNNNNGRIRVIMGGGRENFYTVNETDPEYPTKTGARTDRNLIEDWKAMRAAEGLAASKYAYVTNQTEFNNVNPSTTDYLFGLFEPSHMQYELDRSGDGQGEPSLTEMVDKSIRLLSRSTNGYMLLVEGGRVDHAHHATNAQRSLADAVALSRAVERAMNMTSISDTLIIVTADHSHAFTFNGYPTIDNDIFGLVDTDQGDDGLPYLTLAYNNGPGFYNHRNVTNGHRLDLTNVNTSDIDFLQDASLPLGSETHGGEDVAIHARGPLAHLLTGVHEQHYIGHVAMYASCVGPNKDHCATPVASGTTSLATSLSSIFVALAPLLLWRHL